MIWRRSSRRSTKSRAAGREPFYYAAAQRQISGTIGLPCFRFSAREVPMEIQQAISAFLDHRRARRRSPQTIGQYQYQLEELWLTWRRCKQLPDDLKQITLDDLAA